MGYEAARLLMAYGECTWVLLLPCRVSATTHDTCSIYSAGYLFMPASFLCVCVCMQVLLNWE